MGATCNIINFVNIVYIVNIANIVNVIWTLKSTLFLRPKYMSKTNIRLIVF